MPTPITTIQYSVQARTQLVGYHYWPGATLPAYKYLSQPHRHVFELTVTISVNGANRVIECNELAAVAFHNWQSIANPAKWSGDWDFGPQSCEQMAEHVARRLFEHYDYPDFIEVWVLEDGINGGGVHLTYDHTQHDSSYDD